LGTVIGQTPAFGKVLKQGAKVNLVVSRGKR
jgi:beta-lactam-binding protein with PASTA domain